MFKKIFANHDLRIAPTIKKIHKHGKIVTIKKDGTYVLSGEKLGRLGIYIAPNEIRRVVYSKVDVLFLKVFQYINPSAYFKLVELRLMDQEQFSQLNVEIKNGSVERVSIGQSNKELQFIDFNSISRIPESLDYKTETILLDNQRAWTRNAIVTSAASFTVGLLALTGYIPTIWLVLLFGLTALSISKNISAKKLEKQAVDEHEEKVLSFKVFHERMARGDI
ncbi:hypothetical protein ACFL5G_05625 [Candidatus Margulisiibacteriota bacterium]